MQQLSPIETALLGAVDSAPMLGQVQQWSAVNTGTGNLAGLAKQAAMLAEAFSALPGVTGTNVRGQCPQTLRLYHQGSKIGATAVP